jgi:hypothetical protein
MPRQRFCYELWTIMARRPTLDEARVEVDDPVFRDVALVERPFANAVVAGARRREHLDGEQQCPNRVALARNASPFVSIDGENVRLGNELRLELNVGRRRHGDADALGFHVSHERCEQTRHSELVGKSRGRRHEQLALHQLVSRRREWRGVDEGAYFARGPAATEFRRHSHNLLGARRWRQ